MTADHTARRHVRNGMLKLARVRLPGSCVLNDIVMVHHHYITGPTNGEAGTLPG